MTSAAPANMQTSRNLTPQLRTHFTPARRTSRLNCPSVPGIARKRACFFRRPQQQHHPHSTQHSHAPAPASSTVTGQ